MRKSTSDVMRLAEWADRTDSSERTAQRHAAAGLIPAIRIGRRWVIPRELYAAFLRGEWRPADQQERSHTQA